MATISGKNGKVTAGGAAIADVTRWELTLKSKNPAYASSSTDGWKTRRPGVREGSGAISFKLDLAQNPLGSLQEGMMIDLRLYLDSAKFYQLPAIVDEVRWLVDIDDGEIVGGEARFSSTGPVVSPTFS